MASRNNTALLLGIVACVLGFVFLFVPVKAEIGADCGSVFGGGDLENMNMFDSGYDLIEDACSAARIDRWQYSAPLIALGGALWLGASLPAGQSSQPAKPNEQVAAAED
ncbi:hypothetical protein [Geodermatophilus sp. SYSU D01036]